MNRVELHVIAGLGGWFTGRGTRWLDQVFDDLSVIWDATWWTHQSYKKIAAGIIARQKRYKDNPTVILVGHSYGALRCKQIAVMLKAAGIEVDYIAGIDATCLPRNEPKMVIPTSVEYVDEFWSSLGWFNCPLRARRYTPDGSKGGKYVYPRGVSHKIYKINAGHIQTASAPRTRNIIVQKVMSLV